MVSGIDAPAGLGPRCERWHERVVAAGVKEHQTSLGLRQHAVATGLQLETACRHLERVEVAVDRNDEISTFHLHAVAGEVEQGDIGAANPRLEFGKALGESGKIEIYAAINSEAEPLELGAQ